MEAWHDFFLGEVGASAALIGLVFVSVSINLSKIIESRTLASRALEALLNLVVVLFTASAALVPISSNLILGIILLAIALLFWGLLLYIQIGILRRTDVQHRQSFLLEIVSINQAAALLFFLGALGLIIWGENSLYLSVGATFWRIWPASPIVDTFNRIAVLNFGGFYILVGQLSRSWIISFELKFS